MKTKKRKICWLAVVEVILFLISLAVIVHDFYMVTIYSWIHSITVSWTWFGLGTLFIAFMVASVAYEDLEERANRPIKKERA